MASESLAGSARQKSATAPALQASREAAAPPPPKAPEAWLAEIRSLRGQGKLAEAESSLREFRAAYPDYPLPEDFR
jgi:TolA-binding protein